MDDNMTWAVHGTGLVLIRSTAGDGGWSLHTPEQIADADAIDDVPEVLLSGDAQWDAENDEWDRPTRADCVDAYNAALALEYERGKQHGADDRKMIEQQNRTQAREIDRLKGEIAKLKRDIYAK
jgi:hypothetical protein